MFGQKANRIKKLMSDVDYARSKMKEAQASRDDAWRQQASLQTALARERSHSSEYFGKITKLQTELREANDVIVNLRDDMSVDRDTIFRLKKENITLALMIEVMTILSQTKTQTDGPKVDGLKAKKQAQKQPKK